MNATIARFLMTLAFMLLLAASGCEVTSDDNSNNGGGGGGSGSQFTSEGTDMEPVSVTYLPFAGTVGPNDYSHYRVEGSVSSALTSRLIAGAEYEVSLYGMNNDADLDVYSDLGFQNLLCSSNYSGTAEDYCNANANSSGELYIRTHDYSGFGTGYTMEVNWYGAGTSGGSTTATALTVNGATESNYVDYQESHFYTFYTTSGVDYTVTLTPIWGDPDLYIYSDDQLSGSVDSSSSSTAVDEVTFTATQGQYWVEVYGYSEADYTIGVVDNSSGGSGTPELSITLDLVTNSTAYVTDMTFTVTNNGDGDAGAFTVMLWSDRVSAPDTASAQSGAYYDFTSLAAGASQQITASGSGGTFYTSTSYTGYAFVDFLEDVAESNETNNLATLVWTAN